MSDILTVKQVAALIGCSESLVRTSGMKVKLGAFIVGSRGIRFFRHMVDQYIERMTVRDETPTATIPKVRSRQKRNLTSKYDLW